MAPLHRTPFRTTTTLLAATASLMLAASGFAQTDPSAQSEPPAQATPAQATPAQPAPAANQAVARQHLTAARNALAELTQLPAAAQLTGESRNRVQQLITSFNELITKNSDWRASYGKVETSLAALLEADEPEPGAVGASGTAGAVGTTGTTRGVDPTIRAKLVEFGTHLAQFENVAASASSEPSEPAAPTEPTTPAGPPTTEARPDAAATAPDQDTTAAAQDLLRHVEAIEVILNAQAAAQAAATSAAGGAVTTSPTPSGSTRTTITGPDVRLSAGQIEQIKRHLAELRQLIDRK